MQYLALLFHPQRDLTPDERAAEMTLYQEFHAKAGSAIRAGDALEANKAKAVEIQSEEVFERYMKYLRGCEFYFSEEMLDVSLVTYLKPDAAA